MALFRWKDKKTQALSDSLARRQVAQEEIGRAHV